MCAGKLYPNVDFYSGIILRAIGIPVSMFTVLFAVARTAGWISQWKEMIENPDQKVSEKHAYAIMWLWLWLWRLCYVAVMWLFCVCYFMYVMLRDFVS